MKIKFKLARRRKLEEIEIEIREVSMVQPGEARGRKSICVLVDLQDYDAACKRLEELGVPVAYQGNKPVVNVDLFREASKKWFKRRMKGQTTP